jgi:PAS domain S-box-containing protein
MRGSRIFLGAAALSTAVLLFVLSSSAVDGPVKQVASNVGFLAGSLAAALACVLAARRSGGRFRRAWTLLSLTSVSWFVGNACLVYSQFSGDGQPPYPSVSDAFWLAAYLPAVAALLSFPVGSDRGSGRVRALLDGLIVAGSVLFVSKALVLTEVITAATGTWLARTVFLSYPMADIVLVTLAVLLIARTRGRVPGELVLVALGLASYGVADTIYAGLAAAGTFRIGTLADLGWICGYLLVAFGATASTAAGPAPADPAPAAAEQSEQSEQSSVIGSLMVYLPVLAAVVVGVAVDFEGGDVLLVATGVLVLGLFGTRQTLQAYDNVTLRRELEDRVVARTRDLQRLARQSERILASVAEGIYGVDRDGRLTFVNPAAAEMLGRDVEELIGRRAAAVLRAGPAGEADTPGPGQPALIADIDAALRGSEDVYVRKNGSTFPVEVTTGPLVGGDGLLGAVVAFRDVTERRELDRIKSEFVSVVSHELRTPLTSIRGSLGLLAGGAVGDLPASAARMIGIALDNCERLTRLINDILDIERLESGATPMKFAPHEVREIVTATVEALHPLADGAGVRLVVDRVEGRVHVDRDRIVQTLTNLIGNAVKFSPRDSTVTLSAISRGGLVEFAVSDQGRGIPDEQLDAIFGRFQQVDSSDSRSKGGTGPGLAISRGIVERHGGRIWAQSGPGEGACFRFTLPSVPDAPRATELGSDEGRPAVLLCDDDPDLLAVLEGLLARRGYQVSTVTDAAKAVRLAERDRPDVVVLDLRMPGMTGWEAVEELQDCQETADIPIIIMSGLSPVDAPELSSRIDGWVTKPVDESAISHAVAAAIRGHARRPMVLLVEDDEDLSSVLVTMFERRGIDAVHASTRSAAVALSEDLLPDAIVLDLYLPDGDGFAVVESLRRDARLASLPLIVYSAREVAAAARDRLQLGHTLFLTKGRVPPQDLEEQLLDLIGLMARTKTGDSHAETASAGRR